MINLHERMLPTSAGVEPATSCAYMWNYFWATDNLQQFVPKIIAIFNMNFIYRIRPNNRTVCLGFSKLLWKLVLNYVSTYDK